jgi:hypothetical protein
MKKRRYLKDLIPVDINKLVLETGYFEIEIGGVHLSLAPERAPNGRYYVTLFRNHLRQPECWELSARPHRGRLANGASIPYRNDEVYYAVSGDRRFAFLFIDPEPMRIGTRSDFYPKHWQAYPRGAAKKDGAPSKSAIKAMEKELYGERDERDRWEREYKRLKAKMSYLTSP